MANTLLQLRSGSFLQLNSQISVRITVPLNVIIVSEVHGKDPASVALLSPSNLQTKLDNTDTSVFEKDPLFNGIAPPVVAVDSINATTIRIKSKPKKQTPRGPFLAPAKQHCPAEASINSAKACKKAYEALKNSEEFTYPSVRGLQKNSGHNWPGVPVGCSIQFQGPYVETHQDNSPYFNSFTKSSDKRLKSGEFREICQVGSSSAAKTPHKKKCIPYSERACRAAAKMAGFNLGGKGFRFKGHFSTKGCFGYKSDQYKGVAYFGIGGTLADRKKKRSSPKIDVPGADCSKNLM